MRAYRRKCNSCGNTFWDFTDSKENWSGAVCSDCAIWLELIRTGRPYLETIAGICYDFLPPQKDIGAGDTLGGGRMRYILKKDGSVKKSNDIWKVGVVPYRFRDKLPDTGWWITRKVYYRLLRGTFSCENMGCYDRYHCLRYNIKSEYGTGPYNIIPKNWIVGDERCPSFCNILEIEHFDDYEILDI